MIARRLRSRRHRRGHERGAVMVELVFIVPVLVVLILGMFEMAQAWRTNQTVVQAARSGARTVSQIGTRGMADQQAVLAVAATFGTDVGNIQRIVIFDASTGYDVPAACNSGSQTGVCNVYGPTDIAQGAVETHFDANGTGSGCASAASSAWCPDSRDDDQATASEVGVFVEYQETYSTGFFGGGTYLITETTVMRIEPKDN